MKKYFFAFLMSTITANSYASISSDSTTQFKYGTTPSFGISLLSGGFVGIMAGIPTGNKNTLRASVYYTPTLDLVFFSINQHLGYGLEQIFYMAEQYKKKITKKATKERIAKKGIGIDFLYKNYTQITKGIFSGDINSAIDQYSVGVFYVKEQFKKDNFLRSFGMQIGLRISCLNITSEQQAYNGGSLFGSNPYNETSESKWVASALFKLYWNFYQDNSYVNKHINK